MSDSAKAMKSAESMIWPSSPTFISWALDASSAASPPRPTGCPCCRWRRRSADPLRPQPRGGSVDEEVGRAGRGGVENGMERRRNGQAPFRSMRFSNVDRNRSTSPLPSFCGRRLVVPSDAPWPRARRVRPSNPCCATPFAISAGRLTPTLRHCGGYGVIWDIMGNIGVNGFTRFSPGKIQCFQIVKCIFEERRLTG